MKDVIVKAGALAVLGLFLAAAGWAQQTAPTLNQPKPGQAPKGGAKAPVVTKAENEAYKAIYNARAGDPAHVVELGEAFVVKYPMSVYIGPVYAMLTSGYLKTDQTDKMIDAGNKALAIDPDNVDVLPILAWAIPRRVNGNSPDLQKAQGYAHHALEIIATLEKPKDMSDDDFTKSKNEMIGMSHDGLGVADMKTGKYDDAIVELTQAIQLSDEPDPVDNYLLGMADENTSHFTDAIANFTKCAANGPMQSQCKGLIDEAKKKSQNSLEAPK